MRRWDDEPHELLGWLQTIFFLLIIVGCLITCYLAVWMIGVAFSGLP